MNLWHWLEIKMDDALLHLGVFCSTGRHREGAGDEETSAVGLLGQRGDLP